MNSPDHVVRMDDMANSERRPRMGWALWLALFAGALTLGLLIYNWMTHQGAGHGGGGDGHGHVDVPPLWAIGVLPFVAILFSIAILPLLPWTHHWWESNLNRLGVSLVVSLLTIVYYIWWKDISHITLVLEHAIVQDYIPFIVLLFSLYVISGGIAVRGDLSAHPSTNTAFLAVGSVIASFVGTTGAAMLLIRPILQTNAERKYKIHTIVFFIFLVANIGGTLLPIGDPPLFLGYLRGVPFFWTLNLWPQWAVCVVVLLIVYYIWDHVLYRREAAADIERDETETAPLRLQGWSNIFLLGGIVCSVAFLIPGQPLPIVGETLGVNTPMFAREVAMLALVGVSILITPRSAREYNRFNYAAIAEVAALFIGIFIAMQVPLDVLRAYGNTISEVFNQPWHFFWTTGSLSAFLDNAPTYAVFFELSQAMPTDEQTEMLQLMGERGAISLALLIAISLGSVFMGAMSYIGNGPNFMVKAIAEQAGVDMPSFFGYMIKYSIPVLIPLFIIVNLIFLIGS